MRFLNERKGKYLIEEDRRIIADVQRYYDCKGRWPKATYIITWFDEDNRKEEFKTIAQIGRKYNFTNKPGYMKVLNENSQRRTGRRR